MGLFARGIKFTLGWTPGLTGPTDALVSQILALEEHVARTPIDQLTPGLPEWASAR